MIGHEGSKTWWLDVTLQRSQRDELVDPREYHGVQFWMLSLTLKRKVVGFGDATLHSIVPLFTADTTSMYPKRCSPTDRPHRGNCVQ